MSDFDFQSRKEQLNHATALFDNARELSSIVTDSILLSVATLNSLKDMQQSIEDCVSLYETLALSFDQESNEAMHSESIESINQITEDWKNRLESINNQIEYQEKAIEDAQGNLKLVSSQTAEAKHTLIKLLRGFTRDFRGHLDSS